jgi:hypothetical protein
MNRVHPRSLGPHWPCSWKQAPEQAMEHGLPDEIIPMYR